jgi:hypothetical protein
MSYLQKTEMKISMGGKEHNINCKRCRPKKRDGKYEVEMPTRKQDEKGKLKSEENFK